MSLDDTTAAVNRPFATSRAKDGPERVAMGPPLLHEISSTTSFISLKVVRSMPFVRMSRFLFFRPEATGVSVSRNANDGVATTMVSAKPITSFILSV